MRRNTRISQVFWAIAATMMVGCGSPDPRDPDFMYTPKDYGRVVVDATLAPIMNQYMTTAHTYGLGNGDRNDVLRLTFGNTAAAGTGAVGYCQRYAEYNSTTDAYIGSRWVVRILTGLTGCYLRFVVYHELSHCVYRMTHSTNPESILYPIVNTDQALDCEASWDARVDDLFKSIKAVR